jgi:hypothetical protein
MNRFTSEDRAHVRARILDIARSDERTTGGADIGSIAKNSHDRYSDIDITFGLKDSIPLHQPLDDWTAMLDRDFPIVHFFDVPSGLSIYRVILFSNGMEMDLSVSSEKEFGARGPNFSLVFGTAVDRTKFPEPTSNDIIGWGWHHTLHANSAIERGRSWHALFWLNGLREYIMELRCIRFGVPHAQSRGIDQLPSHELAGLKDTLICAMDTKELRRALRALTREFVRELMYHDSALAEKIENIMNIMME